MKENFLQNTDFKPITDSVFFHKTENLIYKIVLPLNTISNISHDFAHFQLVVRIVNKVKKQKYLHFPQIIDIYTDKEYTILKIQFIKGDFITFEDFLSPEIYFQELASLHNQMTFEEEIDIKNVFPWDFLPEMYWDYVKKCEPHHKAIDFFAKYGIFEIPTSYLRYTHNDLHLRNIIKDTHSEKYYIIDIDEIKLCDFRNDIGCSCTNLFGTQYKNGRELYLFISKCLRHYGISTPSDEDIRICAIYGLRKTYHAELFYKTHNPKSELILLLFEQQRIFESLLSTW